MTTAFLSPRSVAAILAWAAAAEITEGAPFRRVQARRYNVHSAVKGRRIEIISGGQASDLRKTVYMAVLARVAYDIVVKPLHPGSIGPLFLTIIQRAFDRGVLPDLPGHDPARLLPGLSAHSKPVGLNQNLFASREGLVGIMDALRWKSPQMPLA